MSSYLLIIIYRKNRKKLIDKELRKNFLKCLNHFFLSARNICKLKNYIRHHFNIDFIGRFINLLINFFNFFHYNYLLLSAYKFLLSIEQNFKYLRRRFMIHQTSGKLLYISICQKYQNYSNQYRIFEYLANIHKNRKKNRILRLYILYLPIYKMWKRKYKMLYWGVFKIATDVNCKCIDIFSRCILFI